MSKFLSAMLIVLGLTVTAQAWPVPTNTVNIDIATQKDVEFEIPQGEKRTMFYNIQSDGANIALTNFTAAYLYSYVGSTNWASITGTVDESSGTVSIPWGPAYDPGELKYSGWLKLQFESQIVYRCEIDLAMIETPGFNPSPTAYTNPPLDFAVIPYTNDPWALAANTLTINGVVGTLETNNSFTVSGGGGGGDPVDSRAVTNLIDMAGYGISNGILEAMILRGTLSTNSAGNGQLLKYNAAEDYWYAADDNTGTGGVSVLSWTAGVGMIDSGTASDPIGDLDTAFVNSMIITNPTVASNILKIASLQASNDLFDTWIALNSNTIVTLQASNDLFAASITSLQTSNDLFDTWIALNSNTIVTLQTSNALFDTWIAANSNAIVTLQTSNDLFNAWIANTSNSWFNSVAFSILADDTNRWNVAYLTALWSSNSIAALQSQTNSYVRTNDTRSLDWTNATISVATATADPNPVTLRQMNDRLSAYQTFYFSLSTTSDIAGWYHMDTTPTDSNETSVVYSSPTNNQYLSMFITPTNVPGITEIQAGVYTVHAHLSKSSAKSAQVKVEAYLLDSAGSEKFEIEDTASVELSQVNESYSFDIILPTNMQSLVTDRWGVKIKVTAIGTPAPDITVYTEETSQGFLQGSVGSSDEVDPLAIHFDGSVAMTADLPMGGQGITNATKLTGASMNIYADDVGGGNAVTVSGSATPGDSAYISMMGAGVGSGEMTVYFADLAYVKRGAVTLATWDENGLRLEGSRATLNGTNLFIASDELNAGNLTNRPWNVYGTLFATNRNNVLWYGPWDDEITLSSVWGKSAAGTVTVHFVEQSTNAAWQAFSTNISLILVTNGILAADTSVIEAGNLFGVKIDSTLGTNFAVRATGTY